MRKQPKFWEKGGVVALLLTPFALLYFAASTLHRAFKRPQALPIPVISIGNVTVGGAGKTPATIAIASILHSLGHRTHILTRGYGATIAAPIEVNTAQHTAEQVGDEALLLARHAPTWAHASRFASGSAAAAAGATIALCDDALQHHALKKNISLLVIDGSYGIGNGLPLPAGPLRESLSSALKRSDAVILIGTDAHGICHDLSIPVFKAHIEPTGDVSWLKGAHVTAFAGIARPQKFYDTLLAQGAVLKGTFNFPDHHRFSDAELATLSAGELPVTTEKDWVRLPPHWQARIRYVPVALRFEDPSAITAWLKGALHA